MLISKEEVQELLTLHGVKVRGAFHIGAHDCEELSVYNYFGIQNTDVIWIDAIHEKVEQNINRRIPNVFQAVISDKDNDTVTFSITNNIQSSSILELGTHATHYPQIVVIQKRVLPTITVDTFMKTHDASKYNFWNFDIQGAELKALMGGQESLKFADALYLEVNTEEVYKDCAQLKDIDSFLLDRGFIRTIMKIEKEGWGDALYVRKNKFD